MEEAYQSLVECFISGIHFKRDNNIESLYLATGFNFIPLILLII